MAKTSKCCSDQVIETKDPDDECYFICSKCKKGVVAPNMEPYEAEN